MFRYERSGKRKRIQKKTREWSLVSAGGRRRKTSSEFQVLVLRAGCLSPKPHPLPPPQKKKTFCDKKKSKIGWVNLRKGPESAENNLA